ncbi:hypothetical protein NEUTE2DRAFT_32419, partial [Neurospora tetrasperma FGSC 2509]
YINNILYNIFNVYATTYLNNILIYVNNIRDYERYINNIFDRLAKVGFSININKYEFYTIRTKYLSLIIILGGIKVDSKKVKVV